MQEAQHLGDAAFVDEDFEAAAAHYTAAVGAAGAAGASCTLLLHRDDGLAGVTEVPLAPGQTSVECEVPGPKPSHPVTFRTSARLLGGPLLTAPSGPALAQPWSSPGPALAQPWSKGTQVKCFGAFSGPKVVRWGPGGLVVLRVDNPFDSSVPRLSQLQLQCGTDPDMLVDAEGFSSSGACICERACACACVGVGVLVHVPACVRACLRHVPAYARALVACVFVDLLRSLPRYPVSQATR